MSEYSNKPLYDKYKEDIVFDILLSLNRGNSGVVENRVQYALQQFNELVKANLITDRDAILARKQLAKEEIRTLFKEYQVRVCEHNEFAIDYIDKKIKDFVRSEIKNIINKHDINADIVNDYEGTFTIKFRDVI